MALENIAAPHQARRWIVARGFGLVHGFGFSFALRDSLQFAGAHLLTSLLSFNVGVELGQIAVLLVLIPVLDLLFRFVVAERMGTIILSALVAHTGWHWMGDRWDHLRQYQFQWPVFDVFFVLTLTRWALAIVGAAAIAWVVKVLADRPSGRSGAAKPSEMVD